MSLLNAMTEYASNDETLRPQTLTYLNKSPNEDLQEMENSNVVLGYISRGGNHWILVVSNVYGKICMFLHSS